tara:strand:- start:78 stop:2102 length:2025 start_codon:yes stop_codon:yes gene_type:complete
MTNLDRVRELEVEAAFALFPAMDEINRRRETELFQLEQAEANVQKYSAALGEALIPSLTAVTEKQSNFLQTLSEFAEGRAGFLVTFLVAVGQNFRSIIGPVATLFITFKSLSIATQTQLAVMRALQAEQDMVNAGFMMGGAVATEYSSQVRLAEQFASKLKNTHDSLNNAVAENTFLTGMSADELADQALELDKAANAAKRKGDAERLRAQAEERRAQASMKYAAMQKEQSETDAQLMQQAKQQAAALNKTTMLLGATGTAMMIFGKNEKMMRAGMILNTAAIFMQLKAQILNNAESAKKTFFDVENAATEAVETAGVVANTVATEANTTAKIRNTAITGKFTSTMGKSLLVMGGMGLAALAAGELLERLGFFASKAGEDIQDMQNIIVSATDVLEAMNDSAFSPENSRKIIEEETIVIEALQNQLDLKGELSVLEQADLESAMSKRALHEQILQTDKDRVNAAHAVNVATEDNIRQFFELQKFLDSNQVLSARAEMFSGSAIGGGSSKRTNFTTKERADNAAVLLGFNDRDDAQAQFDSLTALFGDSLAGIQTAYDNANGSAAGALQSLTAYHGLFSKDEEVISSMSEGIDTASDALDNFNNAREELFFGSRNNMTGDLIRQVQQQGVENLIANTEVVMTNVFNGLTIPQMADIVIEEIEGRGRLNGFNITTS